MADSKLWFVALAAIFAVSAHAQNIYQANGNVGIGTTNPTRKLTVQGSGGTSASIGFVNSSNPVPYVGVAYDEVADGLALMTNDTSDDLNRTPLFIKRESSDVGIGTMAPTARLTIGKDAGTGNPVSIPAAMLDFKAYYSGYDTETVKASIRSGVDGTAEWNTQSGFLSFHTANKGTLNEAVRISAIGNVGIGTTLPGAKLDVSGNIKLSASGASITFPDGTVQATGWTGILGGGDYAESVDVNGDRRNYEPGDVLVIDPNHPGQFLKCAEPYSTFVSGIYSTKPGVVGRRKIADLKVASAEVPMAMVGIVPTKVTAENGSIETGDLLVTSSSPGYAMKGTDRGQLVGAVVGKALGSLNYGKGVIEVLVTMQ